jgi:GWxTD domain-containing protein
MEDGFLQEPGTYVLHITATDRASGRIGEYADTVYVRAFEGTALVLSDLELAVSIEPDTSGGPFVKSGHRVLPNPARAYGLDVPVLYFYGEVYHLPPDEDTYTVQYTVLDHNGEAYRRFPPKTKATPGENSVEVGGFNVAAFPRGDYRLRVEVLDRTGGHRGTSEKAFRIWNPEPSRLTEEQAARFEQEIQYIASSKDLHVYRELDLRGKAEFMRRFWARRDPTPGTPQNELREEHNRRLQHVEQYFQEPGRSALDSDRARIYIVYGAPDEIERHDQSAEEKPYQIWHSYRVEGGVIFVFADLQGYGQYRLIHSTARNELQDPDWQRWVRIVR